MALPTGFKLEDQGAQPAVSLPAGFQIEPESFNAFKMIMNAPGSLYKNTIGGLIQAASSPLQTATGLMDIAAGGLQNLTPKALRDIVNQANVGGSFLDPEAAKRAQTLAGAVGQDYATTYGTTVGFKKAMQEDPFRVAGDVSMLLAGTGALAKAANFGNVGNALSKASAFTNPMNALIKPVELTVKYAPKVASNLFGLTTGVGSDTATTAYQSGLKGKEAFKTNMRGEVPITQVLDDAKTNLATMNAAKQTDYRSGMVDIANDKTVLNLTGIEKALADAESMVSFKKSGIAKDVKALEALQKIREKYF
jgi:hypothetical protein